MAVELDAAANEQARWLWLAVVGAVIDGGSPELAGGIAYVAAGVVVLEGDPVAVKGLLEP